MDEQYEKPESLDRFGDEDLEALGEILDQLQEDGSMDLEELDGFFAALHCCPERVPPREFLLEILGSGDSLENEEIFPGPEAAQLVWTLILKHWNAVGDAFRTGDLFDPLLLEDDEGRASGNNWAVGFLRGVDMREEFWKEILDDEKTIDWFSPILALAHEGDPDPELHRTMNRYPTKSAKIFLPNFPNPSRRSIAISLHDANRTLPHCESNPSLKRRAKKLVVTISAIAARSKIQKMLRRYKSELNLSL